MIYLLNALLLIVEMFAFIGSVLFVILYYFDQIVGAPTTNEILSKLPFSISFDQIMNIGLVCLAVAIICHILREKLS